MCETCVEHSAKINFDAFLEKVCYVYDLVASAGCMLNFECIVRECPVTLAEALLLVEAFEKCEIFITITDSSNIWVALADWSQAGVNLSSNQVDCILKVYPLLLGVNGGYLQ